MDERENRGGAALETLTRVRLVPRLVPKPLWGISAHRLLPGAQWKRIRADALESCGGACVVCGVKRDKGMVGDEVWDYRDGIATLTGVRIVCRDCDAVTHIGSTSGRGYLDVARDHMARVDGISTHEAEMLIDAAFLEWRELSALSWTVSVAPELLARYPELAIIRRVGPVRATFPA